MWQKRNNQTIVKEIRVNRLSLLLHTGLLLRRNRILPEDTLLTWIWLRLSLESWPSTFFCCILCGMSSKESLWIISMALFSSLANEFGFEELEASSFLVNLTQSRWPSNCLNNVSDCLCHGRPDRGTPSSPSSPSTPSWGLQPREADLCRPRRR